MTFAVICVWNFCNISSICIIINTIIHILATQNEQAVCAILCELGIFLFFVFFLYKSLIDWVGVYEFVNLLNDFNPEPQSLCMSLDMCDSNPHASGVVNNVKSVPTSGPVGTTFVVSATYTVWFCLILFIFELIWKKITNTTGVGQTLLTIFPANGSPAWQYEQDFYSLTPGRYSSILIRLFFVFVQSLRARYSISGSFTAVPNIPFPFLPGDYQINCEVCEGKMIFHFSLVIWLLGLCGGGHSNEFLIAQANGTFVITK